MELPFNPVLKQHQWTIEQTNSALSVLTLPPESHDILHRIQTFSSCLFEPVTYISGDTNQGNWGERSNGELVLFDWERFSRGSPVLDLAPLVEKMGDISDYDHIATCYLRYCDHITKAELIRQLIIAKAWLIVEVINILVSANSPLKKKYTDWYNLNLPKWLSKVYSYL